MNRPRVSLRSLLLLSCLAGAFVALSANFPSWQLRAEFRSHQQSIGRLSFSPDDRQLLVAAPHLGELSEWSSVPQEPDAYQVWDWESGVRLASYPVSWNTDRIGYKLKWPVGFSPDGKWVGLRRHLVVNPVATELLEAHGAGAFPKDGQYYFFSKCGRFMAVEEEADRFSIWASSPAVCLCSSGSGFWFWGFSPDGQRFIKYPFSSSNDGDCRAFVCRTDSGEVEKELGRKTPPPRPEVSIADLPGPEYSTYSDTTSNPTPFSADGRRAIITFNDVYHLIETDTWRALRELPGYSRFSPDGRWVIYSDAETTIWDADTGKEHLRLKGQAADWTANGRFLSVHVGGKVSSASSPFTGSHKDAGTWEVWKPEAGEHVARVEILENRPWYRLIGTDSKDRLLIDDGLGTIYRLDRGGGKADFAVVGTCLVAPNYCWGLLAESPPSNPGAVSTPPAIWNSDAGGAVFFFPTSARASLCRQFSNDSRLLALGFDDGSVQVWKRIRPEAWWGVVWLPETWLAALLLILLVASYRADRRLFARRG